MSKTTGYFELHYYTLYITTGTKGFQKRTVERKAGSDYNYRPFADLINISFFLSTAIRERDMIALKYSAQEKLKAICWNYTGEINNKPYTGKLNRVLAFNKRTEGS